MLPHVDRRTNLPAGDRRPRHGEEGDDAYASPRGTTSSRRPPWPCWLVGIGPPLHGQDGFRFKSGVELVNVNVTVTDRTGRFVPGLTQEDFIVYDDTQGAGGHALQRRARAGEPGHRARHQRQHGRREDGVGASRRSTASCSNLLAPEDDVFLFRFGASAELVHDWTNEKSWSAAAWPASARRAAPRCTTRSPNRCRWRRAASIARRRSSSSRTATTPTAARRCGELKQMIRDTEVLVYAVGIDGRAETTFGGPRTTPPVAAAAGAAAVSLPGRRRPWPWQPVAAGADLPGYRRSGRGGGRLAAPTSA